MAKAKPPRSTNTLNKQVIQMPEPSTTMTATVPSENKRTAAPVSIDLQGEIRRRAYELYEQRGCVHGFEQEDWAQAEREVLARQNKQHTA